MPGIANWRKQRRKGTLVALAKKRGKKGQSSEELELAKLQRENARLTRELEKAEIIIGAPKITSASTVCSLIPWVSRMRPIRLLGRCGCDA